MDNKIRRIERRFKNRNDNRQKSGAGNLSAWSLEERVGATIGDRPTVHVETVSSLRKDNSRGQLFWWGGGTSFPLHSGLKCYFIAAIGPVAAAIAEGAGGGDEPVPSSSKSASGMACKRSAADKMLDFMRTFVSFAEFKEQLHTHFVTWPL